MPTPDRFPGDREEDKVVLDEQSGGAPSPGPGGFQYKGGAFEFEDATGPFDPRTGGGLSPAQHEVLDTLVHALAENFYLEVTRTSGKVSNVTVWTDSGKTVKIRELTNIVRSSGKIQSYDVIQYDGAGSPVQTMSYTITRTAGRVSSIAAVES